MDRANWQTNKYTFPGHAQALEMSSLDEFVQYCQRLGAEPLIQVNALGYAPNPAQGNTFTRCFTPEDAADLVRYLNEEKI